MAVEGIGMDDGQFWLPSDFLADDDLHSNSKEETDNICSSFFDSSPAETESDEDEFIITKQQTLTESSAQNPQDYPPKEQQQEVAGSPQSTLCDMGIWSDSNKGSPSGGPSKASSPPSTPMEQQQQDKAAADMLSAAAGEVMRLRMSEETERRTWVDNGRGLLGTPAPAPAPAPAPVPQNYIPGAGRFYPNPSLTQQQQMQAERFYQLKQQQLMKQHFSDGWARQQNRGGKPGGGRPLGLPSSAWPPLQRQPQQPQPQPPPQQPQQPGSGMRAVFLSCNGQRRESAGTGVFLPRRPGNPTEMRRKPACSTVLLPDRVIQALNLNLDDMGSHARLPGGFLLDQEALTAAARANAPVAQPKRSGGHRPLPTAAAPRQEPCLPAEWTY